MQPGVEFSRQRRVLSLGHRFQGSRPGPCVPGGDDGSEQRLIGADHDSLSLLRGSGELVDGGLPGSHRYRCPLLSPVGASGRDRGLQVGVVVLIIGLAAPTIGGSSGARRGLED